MTKYDDRDNYGNKDGNNDDNSTVGSGSDGLIFDPITIPWSHIGLSDEDWATTAIVLQLCLTVYLRVGI